MTADLPILRILTRHDPWCGAAWRGVFGIPESAIPVLIMLGPPRAGPSFIGNAHNAAARVLAARDPGVLALLDVVEHDRRIAWVYEDFDGVALLERALVLGGDGLPSRVSAELVAQVAETLLRLPGRHPGPETWDVLVDESGAVKLAGFVGPTTRSPRLFAPFGDSGDAAVVFRLGVYFGTLLAGVPPAQASDERRHAASVRRLLVTSVSRPSVGLPDALGDCVRAMLSWDPDDRPALADVSERLRAAVDRTQPSLVVWCGSHVAGLRRGSSLDLGNPTDGGDTPIVPYDFLDGDELTAVDDPTAVGLTDPSGLEHLNDLTEQTYRNAQDVADRGPNSLIPSLFPVQVGPPPEIAKKHPMLPEGFLSSQVREVTGDMEVTAAVRMSVGPAMFGLVSALVLVVAMFALTAVLVGQSRVSVSIEPRIADVLPRVTEDGERFELRVLVRGGEPFSVTCADGAPVTGVDEVVLENVSPGACQLVGELDGLRVLVPFDAYEAGTIRCFQTRQARCR